MKTPAQYTYEIDALDAEKIIAGGKPGKKAAEELREKLRGIEQSLNLDLHALRSQFQGRQSSINIQNTRRGAHTRPEDETRLEEERQARLAPYEEIRKRLEELLTQLEPGSETAQPAE